MLSFARTRHGEVCLQGAHVTRWSGGGGDVLFMSRQSRFEPGQAIRGGVPIIFPWFGDDPEGRGRSAHGFARRLPWRLIDSVESADQSRVTLELNDDDGTRALWPHAFGLRVEVVFGADALELTLRVENRGAAPFRCETALHTYLAVGDVQRIGVRGLEGVTYLDKVDGMRKKIEGSAPIVLAGEVDRVYVGTTSTCRVEDPVRGRTLEVQKEGSRSTIVWNPGREKCAQLKDMADDEWPAFVCIESGNVGDDALTLAPGAEHNMRVRVLTCRPS